MKAQRIVVECLRLDSGFPIITADFAQSLRAPSLRQQLQCIKVSHETECHTAVDIIGSGESADERVPVL